MTERLLIGRAEDAAILSYAPRLEHRLTVLDQRLSRAQDACEAGAYELLELGKRLGAIEDERAKIHEFMAEVGRGIEIEAGRLREVAGRFATWGFLTQKQKRKLLQAYGARIEVRRPERDVLHVVRVDLQSVAIGWLYKKMKRYGIE